MGTVNIGGYDPNSGFEPDDSTGIPWRKNVRLPGQWQGGGQGFGTGWGDTDLPGNFGRGGFRPAGGAVTAPASGPPPGVSLSSPGGAVGGSADGINMSVGPENGPQVVNPASQPLRTGASPAIRTGPGPATDATFAPGSPIPTGGGGGGLLGWLPSVLGGRATPAGLAVGGAGVIGAGLQNEKEGADAGLINPHGTGPQYNTSNLPLSPNGPLPGPGRSPSGPSPFTQPMHPNSAAPPLPFESGFPAPAAGGDPRTGEGAGQGPISPNPPGAIVPPPIGSPAPAMPPRDPRRVPRAAGPAAAKQQPNMGLWGTIDRPNMDAARGGRNNPGQQTQMGVMDLSKLFARNQQ